MQIPIDAIRENGNLRQVKPSVEADAALLASIQAQGVLMPVLVRPDGDGRYQLVAGHRRLRVAREIGLTEIPAEVQMIHDNWAIAAQAAENMVRAPMHPVDQWRAVRDLMASGFDLRNAAGALGLDERQTRRMERLGMLDPEILVPIEGGSMPSDRQLRVIASAPRERQAKAIKARDAFEEWNGERHPRWDVVADLCEVRRFLRGNAIFDIEAMAWDVDLFAQPGADDEYTTTDGETFMRLQQQALETQVADAQAKKQRIQITTWISKSLRMELPAGFKWTWDGAPEKPKRTQMQFVALDEDGRVRRALADDINAVKAAEAKKAERAAAKRIEAGGEDDAEAIGEDAGDDEDFPAEPAAEPEVKPGITKAGMAMIAAAKTAALRETLRTGIADLHPPQMLALMVLTFGAANVSVQHEEHPDGYDPNRWHFRDVISRLLLPGGVLDDAISMADVRGHAAEIMARVLSFGGASGHYSKYSEAAAEWVGAAIGADHALPRFDTAEFLTQINGDELRRAAETVGEKTSGTVKALRERLVGRMPDWRPGAAAFGAPAPVLERK